MHHSLDRRPSSEVTLTSRIKVIMVTDDSTHARMVRDGLETCSFTYLITELTDRATLALDLEAEIAGVRGLTPVIVMVDCAFARHDGEAVVAQAMGIKGDMALECLITRAPDDLDARDRLRALGAFLLDGGGAVPQAAMLVGH